MIEMGADSITKKPFFLALIAIVIIAILAGAFWAYSTSGIAVANGDTVKVYYTGKFTNGTVFNTNAGTGEPFEFVVGANQVIPGFDQAVIGMRLNQSKTVVIPVNEAYGPVNPAMIVSVSIDEFVNRTVDVGQTVTETSEDGEQFQGIVTQVNSTNATVDFNSPLAGKTLVFNITVVAIEANSSK